MPAAHAADPITFAVIGDFGDNSAAEASVANMVNGWNPDFIVTTGDNRYGATTFDLVVGKYYCDYLKDVAAGANCGGGNATTNAFFPLTGNHDYTDGGRINEYLNYFTLPGSGITTSGTSGNERYYDYVYGPIHFFVIDSQGALTNSGDMAAQKSWLQAQLAASTSKWKIVYFHHPPYSSSSSHGSSTAMRWPYVEWGADAVLNGHDHTYERLQVDGFPYIVNGVGGRSLYGFGTPIPGSLYRYNSNYGANLVTVTDTEITFDFYSIAGGGVLDSLTLPQPTSQASPDLCYSVADSADRLATIDRTTGGSFNDVGPLGASNIEAIAWNLDASVLYAADHAGNTGVFGTINPASGLFTKIGTGLGSGTGTETPLGNGYDGNVIFNDIDGLTIDPATGVLYGAARNGDGSAPDDVLFQIDPTTGAHVPDAFGSGIDFVSIETSSVDAALNDVDDIAINPIDGQMVAAVNSNGGNDHLIKVDKFSGQVTNIGALKLTNGTTVKGVKGLSFHNDGLLYASTGDAGDAGVNHRLWKVDPATAIMQEIGAFPSYNDYEALGCLTGGSNIIQGVAFEDVNANGAYNAGTDTPAAGVAVRLYRDANNNDAYDDGVDTFVHEIATVADGTYSFELALSGDFVVVVDKATLPRPTLSTPDHYGIDLPDFGNSRSGNDFGYVTDSLIGDTIWYDLDGDGVQDSGEPGIAGVTVTLKNGGGSTIDSAVSENSGRYSLTTGSQTGSFVVQVDTATLPAGLTQTGDPDAACPGGACDAQTAVAVATSGALIDSADFGYQPSGTITGKIYDDHEPDGVNNNSDTPLAGVTVGLYAVDGVTPFLDSDGSPLTAATDGNGNYDFANLPGGDYVIVIDPGGTTLPSGSTNFEDPDGPLPNGDSRAVVALPDGGSVADQDFGYDVPDLIEKRVNAGQAGPGDTLTYSLDLFYPGSDLLSNVTVVDAIPAGTTYVLTATHPKRR